MRRTVSEKGQVTVPKPLRERLGLRPGDAIEFTEEGDHVVMRRAVDSDPVDSVYGVLELRGGTDTWLTALRGGPPDAV